MNSYSVPDVNVWLALTRQSHQHFQPAWNWYESLPDHTQLVFCRTTQLGYLRLLTSRSVWGDNPFSQARAWQAYDRWLDEGAVQFHEEPFGVELELRALTNLDQPITRNWTDSYLVAFAAARSMELVTFDKGLSQRYGRSVLLTG